MIQWYLAILLSHTHNHYYFRWIRFPKKIANYISVLFILVIVEIFSINQISYLCVLRVIYIYKKKFVILAKCSLCFFLCLYHRCFRCVCSIHLGNFFFWLECVCVCIPSTFPNTIILGEISILSKYHPYTDIQNDENIFVFTFVFSFLSRLFFHSFISLVAILDV